MRAGTPLGQVGCRRPGHWGAAALTVSVVLAGLSGCGGSQSASGQIKALNEAVAHAKAETSAKVLGHFAFKGSIFGGANSAQEIKGSIDWGAKPKSDYTVTGLKVADADVGNVHIVVDNDVLFANVPTLAKQSGKDWLFVAVADMRKPGGAEMGQLLTQGDQLEPIQYLVALQSADKITQRTETVDGVRTTRYGGHVDVTRLLREHPGEEANRLQRALASIDTADGTIDVNVDSQERVRRVTMSADGTKGSTVMALDYSDFGTTFSVTRPAKTDTIGLTDLAKAVAESPTPSPSE